MRLFNISTEYALKLLICLARSGKPLPSSVLSREVGVSPRYMLNIGAKLRDSGLIKATHGVKGGFELGRPPGDISVMDVMKTMGCRGTPHSLSLGDGFQALCRYCKGLRSYVHDSLAGTTIADLL